MIANVLDFSEVVIQKHCRVKAKVRKTFFTCNLQDDIQSFPDVCVGKLLI